MSIRTQRVGDIGYVLDGTIEGIDHYAYSDNIIVQPRRNAMKNGRLERRLIEYRINEHLIRMNEFPVLNGFIIAINEVTVRHRIRHVIEEAGNFYGHHFYKKQTLRFVTLANTDADAFTGWLQSTQQCERQDDLTEIRVLEIPPKVFGGFQIKSASDSPEPANYAM